MVYGIVSYSYQYNTRDTFGFALKSTYALIDGNETLLFKDPKTDSGFKKSQKGMVVVYKQGNEIVWKDGDSVVFNFAPTDMVYFRNRITAMVRNADQSDSNNYENISLTQRQFGREIKPFSNPYSIPKLRYNFSEAHFYHWLRILLVIRENLSLTAQSPMGPHKNF